MNDRTQEIARLLREAIECEERNEIEEARKLYARCVELDDGTDSEGGPAGRPPIRLSVRVRYVSFLRDRGDAQAALDIATSASQRWPDTAALLSLMAGCYRDMSEFAKAEHFYRRAFALDQRPTVLTLLAACVEQQNREAEALELFCAVVDLDPDYEEAHYNIGRLLKWEGRFEAAIVHLERATAIDPNYALAHCELANALMRLASERKRKECLALYQKALIHLERSIELEPNYYWSRLYLACALFTLERQRRARAAYEETVRRWPDEGLALAAYADFLSSNYGPSAIADDKFKRAAKLDPEEPAVRFWYGKHLLRAERFSEARRELEAAERLGHEHAAALLADMSEGV